MPTLTLRTVILIATLSACAPHAAPPTTPVHVALESADCTTGGDDTAAVQAAMTAGACLAPGTYHIDAPALNAYGRRRDAMLSGGVLCGTRSAETTVLFRGDAHALFWLGVLDADVHDVRLDSSCLTNTVEQSHLIRLTSSHAVRDAVIAHPHRATPAGDAINIVGPAVPIAGLVISHVALESCARFGVQITRGVDRGVLTDVAFGDGCAFGSEGSGAIDGLLIAHSTFVSSSRGLAINAQSQTGLRLSHVDVRGRTILLYHCDGCTLEHVTVSDVVPSSVGDFASAVTVAAVAHGVRLSDVHLSQLTTAAAPVVRVASLRSNVQADLADITIDNCTLAQGTPAPVVSAQGVSGITVSGSAATYSGPSSYTATLLAAGPSAATAPATSVPTTGVVVSGNVLVGLN